MRRTWLLGWVSVACVAAVVFALVAQHGFGMQPCPWCTLQRLIYLVMAVTAALGWLVGRSRTKLAGTVAAVLAIVTAVLGGTGVASALHQHFVAAQTASCAFTFADKLLMQTGLDEALPSVFQATASCSEASVSLLGVPFAFWSLALFVLVILACLAAIRRAPARR